MSLTELPKTLMRRAAFGRKTRAEVWQLMADLTGAKMDVADALNTTATVYRQRGNTQVANVLLDIRAAIPRNDLPNVIARYAPGGEGLLFASFGQTDAFRLFRGAARIARAELVISRSIQNAVAGPAMIGAVLSAVLYIAGSQLFPNFLELAPIEQWPGSSRWFGRFTMWFARSGFYIALFAALFGALVTYLTPNWIGKGRKFADNMPPFSFYKLRLGASFLFAIVEGGRMGQAINSDYLYKMAARGSPYARDRIRKIANEVTRVSLGAATLAADQDFPAKDLNTILVAFSSQENWLEKLAGFTDRWIEDVENRAKRVAASLNAALLSVATVAMGLLINSIFAIMQSLSL